MDDVVRMAHVPSWLLDGGTEREILALAESLGRTGAWAINVPMITAWWSDETYRILGRDRDTLPASPENLRACTHPDDREEVDNRLMQALRGTTEFEVQHRIILPDGEIRHVYGVGSVTRADDGTPVRMVGIMRDITEDVLLRAERDEAVRALAESEARHRKLAENAWDVVWTMAVDGTITYVSPSVERVRGLTPAEAAAQTLDQIHPPESMAKVAAYFTDLYTVMQQGGVPPTYQGEHEYYRKDGSIMLGELQVIPRLDDEGHVVEILGVTRDISERRALEEQLSYLAVTDALTGVANRRGALRSLEEAVNRWRRDVAPYSLLMLDIDHFKDVNDLHGHEVGDAVLIEMSTLIVGATRITDTFARWGGEEFILLMPHVDAAGAAAIAEKLRELVANTPLTRLSLGLTVSIGVAELHADCAVDCWVRRADAALYDAKEAGRNCVRVSE